MARPIELTDEIAITLADAFREGMSIRDACGLVSIDKETYRHWMHAGRDGDERFVAFFALMTEARARPMLDAWKGLRWAFVKPDDAPGDWKPNWMAAAKFLDLKDPARFKKDKDVTLNKGDEPKPVDPAILNQLLATVFQPERPAQPPQSPGSSEPGGVCDDRQPGPMEAGPAPPDPQPQAP